MLYHYTNSTGTKGIIESGKIWATKIEFLNDTSEFKLAFSYPSFEYARVVLAALIKSDGFKEEKEWRLIYQGDTEKGKLRAAKHSVIPYWEPNLNLKKTLKKLLVGPTPEPESARGAVWDLLVQKRLRKLTQNIISSKVPDRVV